MTIYMVVCFEPGAVHDPYERPSKALTLRMTDDISFVSVERLVNLMIKRVRKNFFEYRDIKPKALKQLLTFHVYECRVGWGGYPHYIHQWDPYWGWN